MASAFLGACAAGPQGEGLIPRSYDGSLGVTPSPLIVAETRVGCVRSTTLELANASPDFPVVVTHVASSDPALSLGHTLPVVVPPGGRRALELHFMPGSAGRISGLLRIVTDEGRLHPLEVPVTATASERPAVAAQEAPPTPLDLVFVLDVSTSMTELAPLRAAVEQAFARIEAGPLDVRFGLTTFGNAVHVHRRGAFLDRTAFLEELDAQLASDLRVPDPELPRQLMNFDLQENSLDALARSAREFAFRPGARRYLLLMTDDTFLEPPATFSDGTRVVHSYGEVARHLREQQIRLFSVHAPLRGRGLSSGHGGQPSLVETTRGAWFPIDGVEEGSLSLDLLLADLLAGRICGQAAKRSLRVAGVRCAARADPSRSGHGTATNS